MRQVEGQWIAMFIKLVWEALEDFLSSEKLWKTRKVSEGRISIEKSQKASEEIWNVFNV